MAGKPRYEVADPGEVQVFHAVQRCVPINTLGRTGERNLVLPFAMKIGRLLLCGARYESTPYILLAKLFSRRDPRWQKELLLDMESGKPVT